MHGAFVHLACVRAAFAPRRRWRAWTSLVLAATAPLSGCYSTQPVTTAPEPGATVVLDLNDRARYLLGDRIGPSAASIEGVMQSGSDSGYVIRISSVSYLNGQSNKWSGEPFTVAPGLVSQAWRRDFSRSRTVALGVGIGAALLSAILKTNLFGSGSSTTIPTSPPGGGTS
jgi:hypothetical protein